MSRIMEAWEQVLRDAISSDYDEQQYALLQIGMVLQRHNPNLTMDSDAEEETLSRELLRLSLNDERQADTVKYLVTLVEKKPKDADSFLYVLGNAKPKVLVEPLLQLLLDLGEKLKPDAAYQALNALAGVIKYSDDTVKQAFNQYDIIPLLDDWSESDDELVADKADLIADKIVDLLDDETEEREE